MKTKTTLLFTLLLALTALISGAASLQANASTPLVDFEGGLPAGWFDFAGGGATEATTALLVSDTDPLARPDQVGDNTVLEATFDVTSGFAGFGQDFSASTGSQDWSSATGVSFWMYGFNSGNTYQFEIFDNRSDPSTDTAERFDTLFTDDFSGWQQVTIPFTAFTRATDFQPAGAPDDGLTLTEMWGWAVPLDGNAGTLVLDDIALEQAIIDDFESGLPSGTDGNGLAIGFSTFSDGTSSVDIATTDAPPEPVPDSAPGNNVMAVDTNVISGGYAGFIHAFENAALDTWVTQDWSSFEGLGFWLYGNNSGSTLFIDILDNRSPDSTTDDAERWSVDIIDDFSGWQYVELPWEAFRRKEIGNGAPNDGLNLTEVHGWAFGVFSSGQAFSNYIDDVALFGTAETPALAVSFAANNFDIPEGETGEIVVKLNRPMNDADPQEVSVAVATAESIPVPVRDFTPVAETLTFVNGGPAEQTVALETFANGKYTGDQRIILRLSDPVDVEPGFIMQAAATVLDAESFDPFLLDDFERAPDLWQTNGTVALKSSAAPTDHGDAGPLYEHVLEVTSSGRIFLPIVPFSAGTPAPGGGIPGSDVAFGRDFALGQDWSASSGLEFWYYGRNTDAPVTIELLDNRAPDADPADWSLVWSDEFDTPAGTPPNPAIWSYEIGDGTLNGIPGWGNSELQYYTDSTDNVATDGNGNLVITARENDGSLPCYYGPCAYTSARLISQYKAEFAYGRIESRILVPDGGPGLWPAFWSLGTDIGQVGWPQTGEIDIMEYVSRIPDEIFGTIHGPGYAGGASFGNTFSFPEGVASDYHTFAIEWQPDLIEWYVDDNLYHTATPDDVAPNQWVFNDPVFLLLNMAIGGNFGGTVGDDTTFPQELAIDYVRVYQDPDTAERFEATFVDDFEGWQQVYVPFADFTRSDTQPEGAPDDGLGLAEVWGYGFRLPGEGPLTDSLFIDQVRLVQPEAVLVTNANNAGPGSLRQALTAVASGGTITFDPALAAETITLTGPLTISAKEVTVDAADAPGITVSGGGSDRVLIVDAGATATLRHLTLSDGYGWQLAGGVLNNGTLTLDHVTVTGNVMATDAGDFWQGGGGIYNGEGAALTLVDSTVSDNTSGWAGGGVFSFFNTTTTITRSTISGNVTGDTGGGLRLLGNAEITNSTISGNESTGWYGGALFITDGVVDVVNSTIADNVSPEAGPADVFVGTFTDASATLTLTNSVVSSAQENCFYAPFGSGVVTLTADHNNVFTDATCFAGDSDQVVVDAGLGALADNGGPTLTHALLAGSPALDAADADVCPATDQRGTERPQGAGCDVGAFELVPIE